MAATIEEKASEFVMAQIVKRENGKEINVGEYKSRIKDVTELLTEQERVSRKEEQERCITAIQTFECNRCTEVGCHRVKNCDYMSYIRRIIEEGGNI